MCDDVSKIVGIGLLCFVFSIILHWKLAIDAEYIGVIQFSLLIIFGCGIYFLFRDNIKMRVEKGKTTTGTIRR